MVHMAKQWKLKALADIWTGDLNREGNSFKPTGLLGSIRWWYEVLVRGLGGKACDPTADGVRCPAGNKNPHEPGHHCVVCELFGCTGWARKFRLVILDENDKVIQKQIRAGQTFTLRFIPLRPITSEEWCLLDATLRLIAEYGAIGGKTVFKPSDEQNRQNEHHHRDFGLVQYVKCPVGWQCDKTLEDIRAYVTDNRWLTGFPDDNFSWASLQNFWFVKGRYLTRIDPDNSSFNRVVGRNQSKRCKRCNQVHLPGQRCPQTSRHERRYSDDDPPTQYGWLAGRQQESKKVFSFKHPGEGGRTFGFVKPGLVDFDEIKRRLGQVWPGFQPEREFQIGAQILTKLFEQEEGA